LSGARLAVVRENLETALKERRAQFEQYLLQEKKKMDSFRLRDVREVLSIEDLKEKVATVDGLMETLEVREKLSNFILESANTLNSICLRCARLFFASFRLMISNVCALGHLRESSLTFKFLGILSNELYLNFV
jgi:hypothetical protein